MKTDLPHLPILRTTESEPKPLEEPKHETKKLKNPSEDAQLLQLGWNRLLLLKNSCFPTSMSKLIQLKIAQRLLLDQLKLEEVTRCITQGSTNGYSVLLAMQVNPSGPGTEGMPTMDPGLQRQLLRNLVSYLKQKQAAGVINLLVGGSKGRDSMGMLYYTFPTVTFHSTLRTLGDLEEEHIVRSRVREAA
uniref:SPOC domain-containing protein n=1 Tax=Capra hircus TaxID=9925 RepID=A0A452ENF0_CAPHI